MSAWPKVKYESMCAFLVVKHEETWALTKLFDKTTFNTSYLYIYEETTKVLKLREILSSNSHQNYLTHSSTPDQYHNRLRIRYNSFKLASYRRNKKKQLAHPQEQFWSAELITELSNDSMQTNSYESSYVNQNKHVNKGINSSAQFLLTNMSERKDS